MMPKARRGSVRRPGVCGADGRRGRGAGRAGLIATGAEYRRGARHPLAVRRRASTRPRRRGGSWRGDEVVVVGGGNSLPGTVFPRATQARAILGGDGLADTSALSIRASKRTRRFACCAHRNRRPRSEVVSSRSMARQSRRHSETMPSHVFIRRAPCRIMDALGLPAADDKDLSKPARICTEDMAATAAAGASPYCSRTGRHLCGRRCAAATQARGLRVGEG